MKAQPNQFSTDNPQSDAMQIEAEQFDPYEYEDPTDDDFNEEDQDSDPWSEDEEDLLGEEEEKSLSCDLLVGCLDAAEEVSRFLQKRKEWKCK